MRKRTDRKRIRKKENKDKKRENNGQRREDLRSIPLKKIKRMRRNKEKKEDEVTEERFKKRVSWSGKRTQKRQ